MDLLQCKDQSAGEATAVATAAGDGDALTISDRHHSDTTIGSPRVSTALGMGLGAVYSCRNGDQGQGQTVGVATCSQGDVLASKARLLYLWNLRKAKSLKKFYMNPSIPIPTSISQQGLLSCSSVYLGISANFVHRMYQGRCAQNVRSLQYLWNVVEPLEYDKFDGRVDPRSIVGPTLFYYGVVHGVVQQSHILCQQQQQQRKLPRSCFIGLFGQLCMISH